MKSIQIDLSCAGESDCDRAGGGGGGGVQRPVIGWRWWGGTRRWRAVQKGKKNQNKTKKQAAALYGPRVEGRFMQKRLIFRPLSPPTAS